MAKKKDLRWLRSIPTIVAEVYLAKLSEKERLKWIEKASNSNIRLHQLVWANNVIINAAASPTQDAKQANYDSWLKDYEEKLDL